MTQIIGFRYDLYYSKICNNIVGSTEFLKDLKKNRIFGTKNEHF